MTITHQQTLVYLNVVLNWSALLWDITTAEIGNPIGSDPIEYLVIIFILTSTPRYLFCYCDRSTLFQNPLLHPRSYAIWPYLPWTLGTRLPRPSAFSRMVLNARKRRTSGDECWSLLSIIWESLESVVVRQYISDNIHDFSLDKNCCSMNIRNISTCLSEVRLVENNF